MKKNLLKTVYILIQPMFLPLAWQIHAALDFHDFSSVFWYAASSSLYTLDAVLLLWILKR